MHRDGACRHGAARCGAAHAFFSRVMKRFGAITPVLRFCALIWGSQGATGGSGELQVPQGALKMGAAALRACEKRSMRHSSKFSSAPSFRACARTFSLERAIQSLGRPLDIKGSRRIFEKRGAYLFTSPSRLKGTQKYRACSTEFA